MAARCARPCALAAIALLALSWPPAASAARRIAPARTASSAPLLGINISGIGVNPERIIAAARALHATALRMEILWSELEPLGPNRIDPGGLASTDRLMNAAAAAHIKVIMVVSGTPCWATSAPAPLLGSCMGERFTEAKAWPPQMPSDYASFVAYLAQRYGPQLAAIEIWNEPDQANQRYFAGPDKASRYAAIVRAAYPAIKLADPHVPVLAGSLVGSNGVFLRALYAAGIKGYYDGLAVHYYNLVLASVRAIREVQLANGDSAPLWLDEFGWTSCFPNFRIQEEQACVTPRIQGRNLLDTVRSLARAPYIAALTSFKLQDAGSENFGVLTRSGSHKPSFSPLSRALATPFGNASSVNLALRARRGRIIASGSGPVGDYMGLEAFHGGVLRYKAIFTLDRFNRYSITLPAALGTHRLLVRVFQYWAGPGKAAQGSI